MAAKQQTTHKKKASSTKVRAWIDLGMFMGMVLVLAPQTTGIPVHEWASFLIIVPFFLHLIFAWRWIVSTTRRLFERIPGEARFNYVLDWLLFFFFATATFSGVVISESALPALGIHVTVDPFWSAIHNASANLMMPIIGIHIAMHWGWIVINLNKYILRRGAPAHASQGSD